MGIELVTGSERRRARRRRQLRSVDLVGDPTLEKMLLPAVETNVEALANELARLVVLYAYFVRGMSPQNIPTVDKIRNEVIMKQFIPIALARRANRDPAASINNRFLFTRTEFEALVNYICGTTQATSAEAAIAEARRINLAESQATIRDNPDTTSAWSSFLKFFGLGA